ncbi:major facilitator superfamily domain-containing protein [Cunninghamella echinulata]|nr:major facilitator superfamily domain-containing protein [Cunninghamella echinulata]
MFTSENRDSTCQETEPLLSNSQIKAKKATPWHIIGPVFLLSLGLGGLIAPTVQFYTEIFCDLYYKSEIQDGDDSNTLFSWVYDQNPRNQDLPDVQDCSIPEVQVIVSRVLAIVAFLQSVSAFLVAGFYGSLSDRFGRKLVCQIFAIGSIATISCYISVFFIQGRTAGALLVAAPVIRGLLVGDVIITAVIHAYVTDCTTPDNRTVTFSRLMASVLAGVTLGPTLSSLLIAKTGTLVSVFYFLFVLYILFFLYAMFILPESLDEEVMVKARYDYANKPRTTFLQKINVFSALEVLIYTKPKQITKYALPMLAVVQCICQALSQPPNFLYAMLTFHWTAYEGGFFLSVSSGMRVVGVMVILPFLTSRFQKYTQKQQQDDREENEEQGEQEKEEEKTYYRILFNIWMARIGLSIEATGFILLALATTSLQFASAGIFQSLAIIALPSLTSLYTTLVDPSQVGALLGSQALLDSITVIISQTGLSLLYSASVETIPNLTLYVCGILGAFACFLTYMIHPLKGSKNIDP